MEKIVFEKSVGALIFQENFGEKKFLLLHCQSGHWESPKGHVEPGETDEQTMRREVLEETGISDVEIIPSYHGRIWYFYRAKGAERARRLKSGKGTFIIKTVKIFLVKTSTTEVKLSSEHTEYRWLNYPEALKRVTFSNGRKLLEKAARRLNL